MEDSVLKTCSKEFILNHFDEVDLKNYYVLGKIWIMMLLKKYFNQEFQGNIFGVRNKLVKI